MIPGGLNLLAAANQLIGFQKAQHHIWKENAERAGGVVEPVYYAPAVDITASIQPVPRTRYEILGLDLQKDYVTVYSQATFQIADLERDRACDMMDWKGLRYNAESNTDWTNQNGWKGTIFCAIGPVPE